jgi:hypothetical protein
VGEFMRKKTSPREPARLITPGGKEDVGPDRKRARADGLRTLRREHIIVDSNTTEIMPKSLLHRLSNG